MPFQLPQGYYGRPGRYDRSDNQDPNSEQFCKLFIGGLSYDTDEKSLRGHFEQYGEIVDCIVMKDAQTKRSRGFGFITYKKADQLDEAQKNRPHKLDGRDVETKRAMPRDDPSNQQPVKKMFVGGLKDDTTEEMIRELFPGKIEKLEMIKDKNTGKSRGFCFITFEDYDTVDKYVLKRFFQLNGRQVEVKKAVSREEALQNFYGRGRGYGPQPGEFGGYGPGYGMGGGGGGFGYRPGPNRGGYGGSYGNQGGYGNQGWNQGNYGDYGYGPQGNRSRAGHRMRGAGLEEKMKVAKEEFTNMPIERKRKLYKCGEDKFLTLRDIAPWSQYKTTVKKSKASSEMSLAFKAPKFKVNEDLNRKISLLHGNITALEIDAVVNATKNSLLGGGGVDRAIHRAAGSFLKWECSTLNSCATGSAKITCGYHLPAKHVIHTVGPIGEIPKQLRSAYKNCLKVLKENQLTSVAFPCISTGVHGYPVEKATHVALRTIRHWLENDSYADKVERIILCVFLKEDVGVYEDLLPVYFPLASGAGKSGDEVEAVDVTNSSKCESADASSEKKDPSHTTTAPTTTAVAQKRTEEEPIEMEAKGGEEKEVEKESEDKTEGEDLEKESEDKKKCEDLEKESEDKTGEDLEKESGDKTEGEDFKKKSEDKVEGEELEKEVEKEGEDRRECEELEKKNEDEKEDEDMEKESEDQTEGEDLEEVEKESEGKKEGEHEEESEDKKEGEHEEEEKESEDKMEGEHEEKENEGKKEGEHEGRVSEGKKEGEH